MQQEQILRMVESIHRDKSIDKEIVFEALEQALLAAAHKRYGEEEDLSVVIDRETGEITAKRESGEEIDPEEFGRVAAQTAKQIIIQKIRSAEKEIVFQDYYKTKDTIVSGKITGIQPGANNISINLGRAEGLLPRSEQVDRERYHVGDNIRCYVVDVKTDSPQKGGKLKIILSRNRVEFVKKMFELEVPELAEGIVEVRSIVRDPGFRTKLAVHSTDAKVDSVGACVGVRGMRIKGIISELHGEKIDVIRFSETPEEMIKNALKPAQISSITLNYDKRKAIVVVPDTQLSLCIGKKGQNVRLASKLTGWDIDIISETKEKKLMEDTVELFTSVEGIDDTMAEELFEAGYLRLEEIRGADDEQLLGIPGMNAERVNLIKQMVAKILDEKQTEESD